VLQRYNIVKAETDEYVSNRAIVLQGLQHKILKSITDDDIKKTPTTQRLMAYGILYDKERLETGKSTQNVQGIYHLVAEIERNERKVVGNSPPIDSQSGAHDTTVQQDIAT
jgi:hypothetical protein